MQTISIHALRGEGDALPPAAKGGGADFYPRPPWGGRLTPIATLQTGITISIHALRGEGDVQGGRGVAVLRYFYPRPPWGGRQNRIAYIYPQLLFLSTPSVGRATLLK